MTSSHGKAGQRGRRGEQDAPEAVTRTKDGSFRFSGSKGSTEDTTGLCSRKVLGVRGRGALKATSWTNLTHSSIIDQFMTLLSKSF